MSKRTPSAEQKAAIEHRGGVWLAAGAGAGKTFVLIEHVYYLIRQIIKENGDLTVGFLREHLAKIVLMTFTNKAAGELEIRLQKYLENIEENDSLFPHRLLLQESIGALNITTIDGFCYLLIQRGYIDLVDSNKEIVSGIVFTEKINNLVDEWFAQYLKQESINIELLSNEKKIKKAFRSIFASPELRLYWSDKNSLKFDEDYFIKELSSLMHFDKIYDLAFVGKQTPKIKKLLEYFSSVKINSINDLLEINDFFSDYGNFPSSEELSFHRELKDFLKKNNEDLMAFKENIKPFEQWSDEIFSIFDFIESHYLNSGGLNFSDLEYYTYRSLAKEDIVTAVKNDFSYFIIDEFQDTSEIQFEIVRRIIPSNLKNLFCVGDIKQAIYGFRGGEIKLVKELAKVIPQNMELTDNYRSGDEIVSFNNIFFNFLLRKGDGFKGNDTIDIPITMQNYANKSIGDSQVEKIQILLENAEIKTLSAGDLEKIEAKYISNYLEKLNDRNVCILYRKLSPVKYLLPLLIKANLSFSLQLKVQVLKDPMWGIFKLLLEEGDQSIKLIGTYLEILNINTKNLDDSLIHFKNQLKTIGLWRSFLTFLYRNGIHNSNYDNNLSLIESLCKISQDKVEIARERIMDHEEGSYSVDFKYGPNSDKIKIMTIHASKGLEFEQIILAGVHTNGKSKGFEKIFGGFPSSFKWGIDGNFYKSPNYLIEELHSKRSEFSESKRLFYVACTRAVKYLTWFDISLNGKSRSYSPNSWINAIRIWEEQESFKFNQMTIKDDDFFENISEFSNSNLPEFHLSSLGIMGTQSDDERRVSLIPELSVTRFSKLALCPRLFYLENVLKITEENIAYLKEISPSNSIIVDQNISEKGPVSSKDRGVEIHFKIEELIKKNKTSDLPQVKYVEEKLSKYRNGHNLIVEVPVRFSLFGHIINGTPDLVLIPKEKSEACEIWDFKTGSEKENASYWAQLLSYAYCYFLSYKIKTFSLKLVYVDIQNTIEKNLTIDEIIDELYCIWSKTNHYGQINKEHCSLCNFKDICREV